MVRVVALDEEGGFFDVDAAGHDHSVGLDDVAAHGGGLLTDGYRVEIGESVQAAAVGIVLHLDPVAQSSEVVAEGDRAAGLDRREYSLLFLFGIFHDDDLCYLMISAARRPISMIPLVSCSSVGVEKLMRNE